MVTIAELEQRVSDNRRAGARLLSTEETLTVLALLRALLCAVDYDTTETTRLVFKNKAVQTAYEFFDRLP